MTADHIYAGLNAVRNAANRMTINKPNSIYVKHLWIAVVLVVVCIFSTTVMVGMSSVLAFGFPLAGWKDVDIVSKIMIVLQHVFVIGVFSGGILLFLLPYIYSHLLRIRRFLETAPHSDLTANGAFRTIEDYKTPEGLLEGLTKLPAKVFVRQLKKVEPMSAESWKKADDSKESSSDALRILISFFHPTIMVNRTPVTALKQRFQSMTDASNGEKLLGREAMLDLAYQYREAGGIEGGPPVTAEDTNKQEEILKKLLPQLTTVWRAMKIEHRFRQADEDDPLLESMEDCLDWGGLILSVVWLLEQLLYFSGVAGSCAPLDDDNGFRQGMTWFYQKSELTYPYIPNAYQWVCPGACHLECEEGYRPRNGEIECVELGGPGMVWSHLMGETPDVVACCIDKPSAAVFTSAYISPDGTALRFADNQIFSIGCGASQSMAVQVCTDSSSAKWQKEGACTAACRLTSDLKVADTSKCGFYQVPDFVPQGTWESLMNETISIDSDSVSSFVKTYAADTDITVPSLTVAVNNLYRLVAFDNEVGFHTVAGPWIEFTTTARKHTK
eukprot:c2584_g1_i1.p1 GENE.c2584_g1_i1~~c2584_g1_i1.p1  ORF type:complete len:597 (-),score=160.59 c2584_g1_i1:2-1672(-)